MGRTSDPDGSRTQREDVDDGRSAQAPQRLVMIAEAAYYRAERRGFCGGPEEATRDWLEAEAEIDAVLAQYAHYASTAPADPGESDAAARER
jgi:hypothetical protein